MELKRVLPSLLVLATALPAQAAYNIYTREGLTLDIGGSITAQAKKQSNKLQYLSPNANAGTGDAYKRLEEEQSDRRTRLGQEPGSSNIYLRGTQRINQDFRATGHIQMGYTNDDSVQLSAANIAIDRRNLGSVAIGKQWLHSIARTGTFYPMETFASQAIRADYTGTPNLTVSAFHMFPSQTDTRRASDDWRYKTQGNGITAAYTFSIAPDHSIRVGAGISQVKSEPTSTYNNYYGNKKRAALASVEYNFQKLTLAADVGGTKTDFRGSRVSTAKGKSYGLKATYEFTPKLRVSAAYGLEKVKNDRPLGVEVAASWYGTTGYDKDNGLYYGFFKKVDTKRYYVNAEYDLRDNLTVYVRGDLRNTKTYTDQDLLWSKRRNKEVRTGITLTF